MSTSTPSVDPAPDKPGSAAIGSPPTGGSGDAIAAHLVDGPTATTALRGRMTAVLAFGLWGLAIAVGSGYGFWYETTPTATGVVDDCWPTDTACVLSLSRPTLLMFVHPRCPCSRAGLNELAVLMARCRGQVDVQVLFFQPKSSAADWAKTDLWETAAAIPGVSVIPDVDGNEHRRFGAQVSGEVLLYQPDGQLSFHGGITAGRGHAGDNLGRAALESLVVHQQSPIRATSVFGCELSSTNPLAENDLPVVKQRQNHER